jgi:peroxiredoxin Q/BCP
LSLSRKQPMEIQVGQKAPDFALPDQDGRVHSLKDYAGSWVLLYFYPKDDTTGCTAEACSIRDDFPAFDKLKAKVLGVSIDSPASHKKFAAKYSLPFTLLSDEQKQVVNLYGVWGKKKFMGREYMGTLRTSFLIDPTGVVAKVYEKVKPLVHAQEVLEDLRSH